MRKPTALSFAAGRQSVTSAFTSSPGAIRAFLGAERSLESQLKRCLLRRHLARIDGHHREFSQELLEPAQVAARRLVQSLDALPGCLKALEIQGRTLGQHGLRQR